LSKQNNRIIFGIFLMAVSFLGLSWFMSAWAYPLTPMHRSQGKVHEIIGIIVHVNEDEIELTSDSVVVEMHGPSWFWEHIAIQEGDALTAQGVFTTMMEHGEGWHETFIPYQITVHNTTYGNVNQHVPIWMQG
jgi:hypothetical protein